MPWRSYFERWQDLTRQNIVPQLLELVPPAVIFDKRVYSPFHDGRLSPYMRQRGIDSLIISGTETDICVLATVLAAVDHGYRVIIAVDALCSSTDATHDALLKLYSERFAQQIEMADTEAILRQWPRID